jgi:hypothetical protein
MSICKLCGAYRWGRLVLMTFVCTTCEDDLFAFYASKEEEEWPEPMEAQCSTSL